MMKVLLVVVSLLAVLATAAGECCLGCGLNTTCQDTCDFADCNGSNVADIDDGSYTLEAVHSGQCLQVAAGVDKAPARQNPGCSGLDQTWLVEELDSGFYQLSKPCDVTAVQTTPTCCLSVIEGSIIDGASVVQDKACEEGVNFEWQFERATPLGATPREYIIRAFQSGTERAAQEAARQRQGASRPPTQAPLWEEPLGHIDQEQLGWRESALTDGCHLLDP
ncbi:unnamed protein product [Vitrella brassicaformis CCMP3155]|uniref:Ricin B lectin domain-containing protein n=1 Tax=Vitrella brassicaformis (strain CCMP3155) TaxID=1169540 RepID=A0A0G4H370_VITBC|nr:unnamed protein product [Vitrella brassicaformis CCMP3155]|eukprot:CEM38155.1 unnamed protein product [Vitrella brassicaformis CCMP3155]